KDGSGGTSALRGKLAQAGKVFFPRRSVGGLAAEAVSERRGKKPTSDSARLFFSKDPTLWGDPNGARDRFASARSDNDSFATLFEPFLRQSREVVQLELLSHYHETHLFVTTGLGSLVQSTRL